MNKKYVTDFPELMNEWDWGKNNSLGLDPNVITFGSKKRAWWKCNICSEEWMATINNRVHGCGCPACKKGRSKTTYQQTILQQRGSFSDQYPDLLKEWDYEKNTISPFEVTSGSKKKVWWKCFVGHSWQDTVAHRTKSGRNCPICSSESNIFIELNVLH